MIVILYRLLWCCERCRDTRLQQTVAVILQDGTETCVCRRHLDEVIRELREQREEQVAR